MMRMLKISYNYSVPKIGQDSGDPRAYSAQHKRIIAVH